MSLLRRGIVAAMVIVGLSATLHVYLLDGLHGTLLSLVFADEDTLYADGYSDDAFRRVKPGMSRTQVLDVLGAPLVTVNLNDGREAWRYSISPTDSSYRVRTLRMRGDTVESISHWFYVD